MKLIKIFFKLIKYTLIFLVIKFMIQQAVLDNNNSTNIQNLIEKIQNTINIDNLK